MTGCAGGGAVKDDGKEYPKSIADMDAMTLGSQSFYAKSFGQLKQKNFSKFFVAPRRNTVEMHLHDGVNFHTVILGQKAREQIVEATRTFLDEWDAHTLRDVKANAKNAYCKGSMDYAFGVVTPSHWFEKIPFYMNCIFVDGQPYLVMRIPSQKSKEEEALYSPYTELYFSRTQAETLAERIDQAYLEQLVQDNTFVEQYSY